jgi:hypothetical protein
MPVNRLRENDGVVSSLRSSVVNGGSGLSHVPDLLKRVIRENRWQEREVERTGEIARFERFMDFVSRPPLDGLGADLETLHRLCDHDPEALDLLDRVTQNPVGHPAVAIPNNVKNSEPVEGNGRQYAVRRLRSRRPDLHAQVLAGELSPHAAMVEAGFRPKTISVPVEPERAAAALIRNFGSRARELYDALGRLL